MADDKSYAWPMIIIGLALTTAGVWKLTPVVYAYIPNEAKSSLRKSFDRLVANQWSMGNGKAIGVNENERDNNTSTNELTTQQYADHEQYNKLEAEAAAIIEKYNLEIARRSPYGREAADALKKLRKLRQEIHTRKYESFDDRRAATYELSSLQLKVTELNLRHKEWKARNASSIPDPEKDPALIEIRRRQQLIR